MSLTLRNNGSGGAGVEASAVLGENPTATNGFDWRYDALVSPPPMNGTYVRIYFPHSDWGGNNDNYVRDIRTANPEQKTWVATMSNNQPLSTSYTLSWAIPPLFPDCYQPKLIIGTTTINMRTQSSYSYTGFKTSCSVRLDPTAGVPVLMDSLPDLSFSDNQPQSIYLKKYINVSSGNLSFAYAANPNLTQSLVTVNDSLRYIVHPVQGYTGTTTATITATGSAGTITDTLTIYRDTTNSPPQYTGSITTISTNYGQAVEFSWENLVSDADLDAVTVFIDGGDNFTVQMQAFSATLTPNAGFSGSDTLTVLFSDGISLPTALELVINVLLSTAQPQAPQNVVISLSPPTSMCLSWNPVNQDVNGLPLNNVSYRIYAYSDAECTQQVYFLDLQQPDICMDRSEAKLFFRIIAINE